VQASLQDLKTDAMKNYITSRPCELSRFLLLGISFVSASGCTETPSTTNDSRSFSLSIESPLPTESLSNLQPRNFDPASITPSISLNSVPAEVVSLGGGAYQVTGSFSTNRVTVDVDWSQVFEDAPLQLAEASETFSVADGSSHSILMEDYNIDFDKDGDLDFNLDELKNGLNPRNSNSCTRCRSDVASHINRIPASQRPEIDGQYDAIWNEAQFKDVNGDAVLSQGGDDDFATDNPGDEPADDGRMFRFASMHDDQNLYLFVLQDTERGSNERITENMNLDVAFAGISPDSEITNVFAPPAGELVFFTNPDTGGFGFPILQQGATYIDNFGFGEIGTNTEVVWEASFDLATISTSSNNFSLDRFLLLVQVFELTDDSFTIWEWSGSVTLNQ